MRWLRNPWGIGGVLPSSHHLAGLVCSHIALRPETKCIEFGPGTGAFTRELLRVGIMPENLYLVETDSFFAGHLRREFPGVRIVEGCATDAGSLPLPRVPVIVSSLPLRNMPEHIAVAAVKAMAEKLTPGGILLQYTYLPGPPVPHSVSRAIGLVPVCRAVSWANVPPAFVWEFKAGNDVSVARPRA